MQPTEAQTGPSTGRVLLGIVVLASLIGRFGGPIGDWAGAVGTAAHEAGHAAAADVLSGQVIGITVFRDGGGVTLSEATDSGWRTFLVSGAGYPMTLFAALALLTGALLGRSSRAIAAAGAGVAFFTLVFWTPFFAVIPGIRDGDQHFTWLVVALSGVALAVAAALPARYDTARRIVLGTVGVGLLSDAFRAADDLVIIEGVAEGTATDADGLAEAAGFLSAGVWAWLMRLALFAIAGVWAWLLLRRWGGEAAT